MSALWIAAAGAVGTLLRYGLSVGLGHALGAGYPFGTLAANAVGSLLLGFVSGAFSGATWAGTDVRAVLGVGLLGGFTTYSSFNLETLRLFQQGEPLRGCGYIAVTVLGCLAAGALGLVLARLVTGSGS